jgi:hypothetical protein
MVVVAAVCSFQRRTTFPFLDARVANIALSRKHRELFQSDQENRAGWKLRVSCATIETGFHKSKQSANQNEPAKAEHLLLQEKHE